MAPASTKIAGGHRPRRTPRQLRRGGFTLVEVAIAMAIFVFGSLAIIRIFPPALAAIRSTQHRSLATRLARNIITGFNNKPANVPDAILSTNLEWYWSDEFDCEPKWQDFAMAFYGTTNRNKSLPRIPENFNLDPPQSALDSYRFIMGERQMVYRDSTATTARLILRTNFPCRNPADPNPNARTNEVRVYKEFELNGVISYRVTGVDHLNFSNATKSDGTSFADTTNPKFPQALGNTARYYVSYTWTETVGLNTTTHKVIDEPIECQAALATAEGPRLAASFRDGVAGITTKVLAGSLTVRAVVRVNPFGATDQQAMVGYIDMGPETPRTDSLVAGDTVLVDYPTTGWDWLVYDDGLSIPDKDFSLGSPSGLPTDLILPIPVKHLDDRGTAFFTQLTASDSNGRVNTSPLYSSVSTATGPVKSFDAKDSKLIYDTTGAETGPSGGPYSGTRTRLVYRTLDEWCQQVAVAARSYVPYYEAADFSTGSRNPDEIPQQPWREYSWRRSDPNVLYFHASEAGKTVMVSFQYEDAAGVKHIASNQVVTIDDEMIARPASVPAGFAPSGFVAAGYLVRDDTPRAGGKLPHTALAVQGVQGLTTAARTAFLDDTRCQQAVVNGYRDISQ